MDLVLSNYAILASINDIDEYECTRIQYTQKKITRYENIYTI